MQTYIDLIALRKQKDNFDKRQLARVVGALQDGGLLSDEATDLEILKCLCEVLYAVHYLASANDLPLDDAYSKMLMHNIIQKDENIGEPIQHIFNKYRTGKLRKAASPIHALMQRVEDVENQLKAQPLYNIDDKDAEILRLNLAVDSLQAEVTRLNSNPPAEQ